MSFATFEDHAKLDRLIKPQAAPERIHGWPNGPLSVARFYGGCIYQGHGYTIAMDEPGQPLVRDDILAAEKKDKSRAANDVKAAQKLVQGDLL